MTTVIESMVPGRVGGGVPGGVKVSVGTTVDVTERVGVIVVPGGAASGMEVGGAGVPEMTPLTTTTMAMTIVATAVTSVINIEMISANNLPDMMFNLPVLGPEPVL